MAPDETARIVALARLCGASGSAKEIADKYSDLYQRALKELSETAKPAETTVIRRPF